MQLDHTVDAQAGPVAGHGVAHTVHHRVGACRFCRIAEVAERQAAALGQPTQLRVAGWELAGEIVAEHVVARTDGERACGGTGAGRHVRQLATCLGGAESVDDHQRRQVVQELFLQSGAQRCSAGEQDGERRQVVRAVLQLVQQGASEGVADDEQEVELLAIDHAPDVVGVEPVGLVLDVHRATRVPRAKAHPVAGAVHEWWRQQRLQPTRRFGDDGIHRLGFAGAEALDVGICVAPQHPFGHARGTPRVEDVEVVGVPSHRRPRG